MALREPSCQQRADPGRAAGDENGAVREGGAAGGARTSAGNRRSRGTKTTPRLSAISGSAEPSAAASSPGEKLPVGVDEDEAAGMLGIGGPHQAR